MTNRNWSRPHSGSFSAAAASREGLNRSSQTLAKEAQLDIQLFDRTAHTRSHGDGCRPSAEARLVVSGMDDSRQVRTIAEARARAFGGG
jgi:hypothetical protein